MIAVDHLFEGTLVSRLDGLHQLQVSQCRLLCLFHTDLRAPLTDRFIGPWVHRLMCPERFFHGGEGTPSWRRGGDSNPWYLLGTHAFQACSLSHSDTSPMGGREYDRPGPQSRDHQGFGSTTRGRPPAVDGAGFAGAYPLLSASSGPPVPAGSTWVLLLGQFL